MTQPHRKPSRHRRGPVSSPACAFTLLELLVVLAILGVLVGLLLPALARARKRAHAVMCSGQLRQLGLAVHLYAEDHEDQFPRSQHSAFAHRQQPWGIALAPYLGSSRQTWTQLVTSLYHCPSDRRSRPWSYGLNVYFELGPEDDYEGKPQTWRRISFVPRPAQTILFAENASDVDHLMPNYWNRPEDAIDVASRRHAGRAHYLFVDGHAESKTVETTFDPARGVDLWHPGK